MEPTEYLRFAAAFIFVLALIGAAAFALRAFGFLQMGQRRPGERRLSITESLLLDARRRVVLIRRDEREYLLLLSPQGDMILDDYEVKDIPEAPLSGSTFVTIKTEPR